MNTLSIIKVPLRKEKDGREEGLEKGGRRVKAG
jgi:hypothetical protein